MQLIHIYYEQRDAASMTIQLLAYMILYYTRFLLQKIQASYTHYYTCFAALLLIFTLVLLRNKLLVKIENIYSFRRFNFLLFFATFCAYIDKLVKIKKKLTGAKTTPRHPCIF